MSSPVRSRPVAKYSNGHPSSCGSQDEAHRYGLYALSFDPGFIEDDVPDFPLHIEDQIKEMLRNYAQLNERVRAERDR